ncbi:MAG: histidine phosphatase family protein, partial [Bacteroidales bacterium]|nr:histidine phosphatase family protein [Bacteroidales bacterium]
EGRERAENWAAVFKDVHFDAIYSTNYIRTVSTAEPTAKSQKLKVFLYHPTKIDFKKFLKEIQGKTVLIVGHSNTIPGFANSLIEREKYSQIEDDNVLIFISSKKAETVSPINCCILIKEQKKRSRLNIKF